MRSSIHALTALALLGGAACARPQEEPEVALAEGPSVAARPMVAAPAGDKPLIHVWKSPT